MSNTALHAAPDPGIRPLDRSLLIEQLGRGLRVIEAFSDAHPRLTSTEAGRLAGLTRTAARRHLASLVHFGYAGTDGKHYWLLPRVMRLGHSYLESARLPRLVQPFLQRISDQTGETANFAVLEGHEVVYLARSNSPRIVSIGFQPGARVPAHVVSVGYACLSTFEPAALEAWLENYRFDTFTQYTLTSRERFLAAVAKARGLGHAATDQQLDLGLRGVAVPLRDRQGRGVGALSMTVQTRFYPDDSQLEPLVQVLQDAAQLLRGIV